MFLKVVRGKHTSLYECERMHRRPGAAAADAIAATAESPEQAEKIMQGRFYIFLEPSGISIEIDKTVPESLGVYVMNNEGRTIDTVFQKGEDVEESAAA